jgi:predicted restriction endonuclease
LAKICEICGWDRNVERAHINAATDGWKLTPSNVMMLCPNHHRAFDSGQLTMDELNRLGIGWLAA